MGKAFGNCNTVTSVTVLERKIRKPQRKFLTFIPSTSMNGEAP